jgi:hypothetical protein
MDSKWLFYYFGDDETYFRALQGAFKEHTRMQIDFKRFYEKEESNIQSLVLKIANSRPAAVFLDFSKHTHDMLHLGRLNVRIPHEHKMVTVGLLDYLSAPEVLAEGMATGMDFVHIKSSETFDVVYDVANFISPDEVENHGFAMAQVNEEWSFGMSAKVGFVEVSGLHIETNFSLGRGDRVEINHFWKKGNVIPSGACFVANISSKDLFYHFKGSADLEFVYVDEVVVTEGMDPEVLKQKNLDRQEHINNHKKAIKKWINDNRQDTHQKKGKVLVVDRALHFYHDQIRSDRHPFTIRCVPFLSDINEEIERLRPQVIAFCFEPAESASAKNTHHALVKMVDILKAKHKDLTPIIVVFNCNVSSKEIQEVLGYTNVMATSSDLSVEILVKMARAFEKKLSVKNQELSKLERIYVSKTHPASLCEVMSKVKVLKLSEIDMTIGDDGTFSEGANLHFTKPVEMYVHLRQSKDKGEFYGLIHCIGEESKQELRRYVNSVFFREHDANVQASIEEFKRLNDAKLQERIEAEKNEQEPVKDSEALAKPQS